MAEGCEGCSTPADLHLRLHPSFVDHQADAQPVLRASLVE